MPVLSPSDPVVVIEPANENRWSHSVFHSRGECVMDRRHETPTVPYISVVIPAYNEQRYLPACLHAVRQQKDAPPYEIIVVDNASTDRTGSIARRYGARVTTQPCKGVARARQTGFEAACGGIIASTDADTRVTSHWLARIATHFWDDPALGAVYGPVHWYDGGLIEQLVLRYPIAWAQWLSHRTQRNLWWGSNFAVRREVFWEAGGFPVAWPTGEDTDLSLRVSRMARVRFDPNLIVYASSRRAQQGWANLGWRTLTDVVERFVLRRAPSLPMADLR
jgi:glycosyltransferase involved in cell wall biosynthesis